MIRFTGAVPDVFVVAETNTSLDSFRALTHRAFCARAILRREAAEMIRVGADAGADVIPVG